MSAASADVGDDDDSDHGSDVEVSMVLPGPLSKLAHVHPAVLPLFRSMKIQLAQPGLSFLSLLPANVDGALRESIMAAFESGTGEALRGSVDGHSGHIKFLVENAGEMMSSINRAVEARDPAGVIDSVQKFKSWRAANLEVPGVLKAQVGEVLEMCIVEHAPSSSSSGPSVI